MRYRMFGERTGLRVSELALGTGTFGTRWGYGAEPEEARREAEPDGVAGDLRREAVVGLRDRSGAMVGL